MAGGREQVPSDGGGTQAVQHPGKCSGGVTWLLPHGGTSPPMGRRTAFPSIRWRDPHMRWRDARMLLSLALPRPQRASALAHAR